MARRAVGSNAAHGYPEKIVKILHKMYERTFSIVRAAGGLSEWFETVVGVLQGWMLSPLLFNIYLEIIIAIRALKGVDAGVVLSEHVMYNLRFADDITAVAENEHHLHTVVDGIDSESTKMGTRINVDKTEVQLISRRKTEMNITVRGNKLKQVREFVYLGENFDAEEGLKPDVRRCGVVGNTLAFGSIGHGFESEHSLFSHHSASAFSKLRSLVKCSLDDSVRQLL